jgi:hypothetical protein
MGATDARALRMRIRTVSGFLDALAVARARRAGRAMAADCRRPDAR